MPDGLSLDRRHFLVVGAATVGVVACGPTEEAAPPPPEQQSEQAAEQPTQAPPQTQRGGILRVGTPGTPSGLDPAIMNNGEAYILNMNTHDNLVHLNPKLEYEPQLAESWSSNDGLTVWTFKLRQGVKFHHGKEFNADDVVFTFKRLLDPETKSAIRSVVDPIQDIEAVDPRTVRFTLKGPHATFPALMSPRQAAIVASDRTPEQLKSEPSGTGPFKMQEFKPDERTIIVRNPDYWQTDRPLVDEVHFQVMKEQGAQAAALISGSIHMMFTVSMDVVPQLQSNSNTSVEVKESGAFTDLVTNTQLEPFQDNRVRTAFKLIADRQALRQAVFSGFGSIGNDDPIAPIVPEHNDSLAPREQDLAQAKQLLTDAGFDFDQEIVLHNNAKRPDHQALALAYQEQAKQAGINLKIERHEDNVYWSQVWLKVPFCIVNWQWRPNIDELCSIMLHSEAKWNESFHKNAEVDELIAKGRAEQDAAQRTAIYGRIQEIVSNEFGLVVPFHWPNINALHKSVKGHVIHPVTWLDLRGVSLEQ